MPRDHSACRIPLFPSAPRLSILCLVLSASVRATGFDMPPEDRHIVGVTATTRTEAEDTLLDIAYRHGLGFDAIIRANPGLDPWLPGAGTTVRLPNRHLLPDAPRSGIVVNLPEMRLYHFPERKTNEPARVHTYPIGIGKPGWSPAGMKSVVSAKLIDPVWVMPESIQKEHVAEGTSTRPIMPPGPDNPLGRHALQLGQSKYLIHGTNRKYGIGMRVSHGCIRLYPSDIEELFGAVAIGTPVRILHQPYKAGWVGDTLLLEAHPPLEEWAGHSGLTAMVSEVIKATESRAARVDWDSALTVARQARGIPTPIGRTHEARDETARPARVDASP